MMIQFGCFDISFDLLSTPSLEPFDKCRVPGQRL